MTTHRSRYGWMALGGLLCLFGVVLACKIRDGNRATAQVEPAGPTLPDTADLPVLPKEAAEPPRLPALPTARTVTAEPNPLPDLKDEEIRPVSGTTPGAGSEKRPIVIPASATMSGTDLPPQPMTADTSVPPASGPPPLPPISGTAVTPPAPPAAPVPTEPAPPEAGPVAPVPPVKPPEPAPAAPPVPGSPDSTLIKVGARDVPRDPLLSPAPAPMAQAGESLRPLPTLRARPPVKPRVALPLTGTYVVTLDAGKAMTLPPAIHNQLGNCTTVLLSPGSDRCLWLTNQAHLDRLQAKLDRSPARESDVRGFKRLYYAQTIKVPVHEGRVVISERLAHFANLGPEVVLVGIDDHFEIWDAVKWRRYTEVKKAKSTMEE